MHVTKFLFKSNFIIRIKKQIININNLNSTFVNKLMQFIQFETFIYTSIYTNNDVISYDNVKLQQEALSIINCCRCCCCFPTDSLLS